MPILDSLQKKNNPASRFCVYTYNFPIFHVHHKSKYNL